MSDERTHQLETIYIERSQDGVSLRLTFTWANKADVDVFVDALEEMVADRLFWRPKELQ